MRTFLQYLALGVVLMVLFYGSSRMNRQAPGEPEPQTTAREAATEPTQPGEPAPVWARKPLRLEEVVPVEEMDAEHIFVYDPGNREMVYCSTELTDRLYPASITKLFSAWVALQILPEDMVVTAGWELGLVQPGSSSAFIALDSRITVEHLIEGMLLPSGNDAALVLAAAVGRHLLGEKNVTALEAVTEFVAEMNRAAEALELQNSHFENPDGYHREGHYSCPADLAKIAALAMDEPVIARCMGLQKDTVTISSGQVHNWVNTNRLLNPQSPYYCPEAVGMKTGYTGEAGYCLMAAFGRERPLIVGIFGGSDAVSRYQDAAVLYAAWSGIAE